MDNEPSPAAAHASAINTYAPPFWRRFLPLARDGDCTTNGIIDGMYTQQIRFEQQHPPQFYHITTTPRIVTQPNIDNSQTAALLNMLRATADTHPLPSPLLHWRNCNQLSTLPGDAFTFMDVSGDLWDDLSNDSFNDLSDYLSDDLLASLSLTPFNAIF